MIDHLGLAVKSFVRSRNFYAAALAPLGYSLVTEQATVAAFGPPGRPLFWIHAGSPAHTDVHLAFAAPDRAGVDAFYDAALGAGAADNGPPGLRTGYHPNYYAAFVLDPDGNNIEAVCHLPE